MRMMKIIVVIGCVAFLSGCALFGPPNEAQARQIEKGKAQLDRDQSIAERTAVHEKEGMSTRDARALAETEYRASGAR